MRHSKGSDSSSKDKRDIEFMTVYRLPDTSFQICPFPNSFIVFCGQELRIREREHITSYSKKTMGSRDERVLLVAGEIKVR